MYTVMATLTSLSHQPTTEAIKVRVKKVKIEKDADSDGKSSRKFSSFVSSVHFVWMIQSTLVLVRDYLRHLGMVAMAVIVAILACSLKGQHRYRGQAYIDDVIVYNLTY